MRLNQDLELDYVRVIITPGQEEFIHSMTLNMAGDKIYACGEMITTKLNYWQVGLIAMFDYNGNYAKYEIANYGCVDKMCKVWLKNVDLLYDLVNIA